MGENGSKTFWIFVVIFILAFLISGCSGATSTAGFQRALDNKGWGSKTIGISAHIDQARYWKGINFIPGRQITIGPDTGGPRRCGNAVARWNSAGIIQQCHIRLNYALHSQGICGTLESTIQHEIGHCLGLPHSVNGIMSAKANGGTHISAETMGQFRSLYGVSNILPIPNPSPESSKRQTPLNSR